jgi:CO/xanthine dehydrogenase FAD-binding subunit
METASPGLPSFDYVRPATPDEVTDLLLKHSGEARLFMGGTDLLVRMRDGFLAPKVLIDVKHLPGMTDIRFDSGGGLSVGAAANMNAIARHPAVTDSYPLLAESINTVASYQLRTRATMGGNLCNASPAADTAPAALVLEAHLVTCGPDGERIIPAATFFLGPGKHMLKPGEFVTRIDFPLPPAGTVGCYLKLGRNTAGDLAIVGVAVMGYPDRAVPSGYRFRVALASVAPTPIRVPGAESVLAQDPINESAFETAAQIARDTAQPISDLRGSADYRRAMVQALTRRALVDVWAVLRKEAAS